MLAATAETSTSEPHRNGRLLRCARAAELKISTVVDGKDTLQSPTDKNNEPRRRCSPMHTRSESTFRANFSPDQLRAVYLARFTRLLGERSCSRRFCLMMNDADDGYRVLCKVTETEVANSRGGANRARGSYTLV